MSLDGFVRSMPKVELHVHLEGSIQPGTLLELAHRHGVALPADSVAGLRELYRFTDFSHFIQVYTLIQSTLRTPEDWALIVRDLGADMARQNIRYAEVTWSPNAGMDRGMTFEQMLAGVEAGRREARETWGVEMRWLPDAVRDLGLEAALQTADDCVRGRDHGVVALGLGGSESLYPPELFEEAFARAHAAGLYAYPHAGELAGPHSVWAALRVLGADRIGHGVRAIEDPVLVAYLRDEGITLDVCPTSNICLHVYPDYASHPLRRLYDAGVRVTVNSDDPPLFNTDLTRELLVAVDAFGMGVDDLIRLTLNAIEASFLPEEGRKRLTREFEAELSRTWRQFV